MRIDVFRKTEVDLYNMLVEELQEKFTEVHYDNKNYIYAIGTIPVMLLAHLDTVHKSLPSYIFYDEDTESIYAREGIGGDDRAGVAAILDILDRGYRPSILFCTGEESGCVGAKVAAKEIPTPNVNILLELDRKGYKNYVTYSCNNTEMNAWVETFGFKKEFGSFSDISSIAPKWEIGAVNLGIGYYSQHSSSESLCLPEWRETIEVVLDMLDNPPEQKYEYKAFSVGGYKGTSYHYGYDDYYYEDTWYGYGYNRHKKDETITNMIDIDEEKEGDMTDTKDLKGNGTYDDLEVIVDVTIEDMYIEDDSTICWEDVFLNHISDLETIAREGAIQAILKEKNRWMNYSDAMHPKYY
jgi:hypothetical protein